MVEMARVPSYPFVPKSTGHMRVGQFWSIPLRSEHFACGRVLQVRDLGGKQDSRLFLAGLLDWIGTAEPTCESIAGARLVAHGAAHIRTITKNRGQILGCRDLALDDIEVPITLSDRDGSQLQQGFYIVGPPTPEQRKCLPIFSTWGYSFIVALAEDLAATRTYK
jgi:hypothetical protein